MVGLASPRSADRRQGSRGITGCVQSIESRNPGIMRLTLLAAASILLVTACGKPAVEDSVAATGTSADASASTLPGAGLDISDEARRITAEAINLDTHLDTPAFF